MRYALALSLLLASQTFASDVSLFPGRLFEGRLDPVLVDLDGDGHLDVVSHTVDVFTFPGSTRIAWGDGCGAFGSATTLSATGIPVAADFDADGDIDLALIDNSPDLITVLLNDGSGQFTALPPIFETEYASDAVSADFDGDGWADLAVAEQAEDRVQIYFGDGTGQLVLGQSIPFFYPARIYTGDFDEDGDAELFATTNPPVTLGEPPTIYFGTDGDFSGPPLVLPVTDPDAAVVGDVDDDGHLDLVIESEGDLLTWTGDGTGAFSLTHTLESGMPWTDLVLGDFDGDSHVDLFGIGSARAIFFGSGDGSFEEAAAGYFATAGGRAAVGDANDDGLDDLAVTSGTNVTLLVGRTNREIGGGIFSAPPGTVETSTADLDGDGWPEVAGVTNQGLFWVTDPDSPFEPGSAYQVEQTFDVGTNAANLTMADVDGDGDVDAVISNPSLSLAVLLNDGTGVLGNLITYPTASDSAAAVGDIDGDGFPDIVAPTLGASTMGVLFGNGFGWFPPPVTLPLPATSLELELADLDTDGDLDWIASAPSTESLWIGWNDGSGSFPTLTELPVGFVTGSFEIADVNADGDLDIVVLGYAGVRTFLGDGSGGFSDLGTSLLEGEKERLSVADLNRDGFPDVAFDFEYDLAYLLGDGTGSFATPTLVDGRRLTVADLNQDDAPDFIVAFGGNLNVVGVLWNRSADVEFRRGDVNDDGNLDLADAIASLSAQFTGGAIPNCLDAADVNDDGAHDVADPITTLAYLFNGGAPPPAPFPSCGIDATDDALGCTGSGCP